MKQGLFERRTEPQAWAKWHFFVAAGALFLAALFDLVLECAGQALNVSQLSFGQAWSNKSGGIWISWVISAVLVLAWRGKGFPVGIRWVLLSAFLILPFTPVNVEPGALARIWSTVGVVVSLFGIGMIARVGTEWTLNRWPGQ